MGILIPSDRVLNILKEMLDKQGQCPARATARDPLDQCRRCLYLMNGGRCQATGMIVGKAIRSSEDCRLRNDEKHKDPPAPIVKEPPVPIVKEPPVPTIKEPEVKSLTEAKIGGLSDD